MPIVGQAELSRRLTALGLTPAKVSEVWSHETLRFARGRVRVRTGRTRASIRIVSRTATGARFVVGGAGIYLEKGTPPHEIPGGRTGGPLKGKAMRFTDGGRTVFAKKVNHPRARRHPFMVVSARAALRNLKVEIAKLWDAAA